MAPSIVKPFLIGARIKCEAGLMFPDRPRYSWNNQLQSYMDNGPSGNYLTGSVFRQDQNFLFIHLDNGITVAIDNNNLAMVVAKGWWTAENQDFTPTVNDPPKSKAQYSIHHGYFQQLYKDGLFDDVKSLIKSNKSRA
jgi:hypothetical protein